MQHVVISALARIEVPEIISVDSNEQTALLGLGRLFNRIKPNKPWNQKPKKSIGSFVEYVVYLLQNKKISKRFAKMKLLPKIDSPSGRVIFETERGGLFTKSSKFQSVMWSHTGELFVNINGTTKVLEAKTMDQLLTQLESVST